MEINVKEHPELRHALAHIIYAIRALAEGHPAEAQYELDSIESLVFWEDDDHMTKAVEGMRYGLQKETEKLQREEELQGKAEVEDEAGVNPPAFQRP